MRPYTQMKDTPLAWIGDIPYHWKLSKAKRLFKIVSGSTPSSSIDNYWNGDIDWITPADLSQLGNDYVEFSARRITKSGLDSCGAELVPRSSIILSTRAPIGSLAIAMKSMCTNQGCKALVPEGGHAVYAYYFLSIATEQLNLRGRGTTFLELSTDELKSFPFPAPPFIEQQKIAQFLDYETAKIDVLIDEQKRLIGLLKEKRQAVISHAVSKGLNPDAPMKDSGVEWLGEVPEHWKVASLKAFIRLVESGTSVNAADTPASEGELGVLKTSAVYGDELDVNQNKTVVKEEESRVSCQLKANRLIVSRMNTPELVGATGFSLTNPGNLFLPDRLWQITLENVEAQFIFMFTLSKSYRSQIKLVCAGASSSMQNIAQEDFKNVKVAVPPLIEQKAIVEEWHRFKSNSNQLTEQAEKAVELLQERRSALISAAVTGKIDVRDWQPPAGSDTVDSNALVQTERHYG
ncbi:restriction endonuclease subunit S [Idiomarina seosinensis]|uniref:Restriction endonuclease subunit S n=1 Tax=Idiomarina seosinensis TaxID=281739 RepID=A0A432ZHU0_9GAMM|nr:restriction endonuclease subunit S [Idiomarina seosinensis]RUO77499.1 restriction endonuclease subunit S [Idiomarina seosinensis]